MHDHKQPLTYMQVSVNVKVIIKKIETTQKQNSIISVLSLFTCLLKHGTCTAGNNNLLSVPTLFANCDLRITFVMKSLGKAVPKKECFV